jgi:propanediol dehydratase small subunit
MLTRADISALKTMRKRVQEIERRLDSEPSHDFPMGRLAEACRAADDSLLQVLILGRVHGLGVTAEDLRLTPKT